MASPCVVMGVTGGIAVYKAPDIVRRLRKQGVEVYVIMTEHAGQFVTPLTFETVSHHPVVTNMFTRETPWEVEHIELAKRADLFVVAPATANFIGKYANGIADDMLTSTAIATTAQMIIAPAMNHNMYLSQANQNNMATLRQRGCLFIGPERGMLANGDIGTGRMTEPEEIASFIMDQLRLQKDLEGKRILVSAGPTREAIDPVRFITNHSTGKMGYAIAERARARGAKVTLVSGPVSIAPPVGVEVLQVTTAQEMLETIVGRYAQMDIVIKAAAPADYRARDVADQKIKKSSDHMQIEFVKNPDIAAELGRSKEKQILVIFAAETNDLIANAKEKLRRKNADLMIANDVTKPGAGFGSDTNIITMITTDGQQTELPQMSKLEVADRILTKSLELLKEKNGTAEPEIN